MVEQYRLSSFVGILFNQPTFPEGPPSMRPAPPASGSSARRRRPGARLENPCESWSPGPCGRQWQAIETYRAYLAKRGGVTLPVAMAGELCSMISTRIMLGRPESMDYVSWLLRAAVKSASSGCPPPQLAGFPAGLWARRSTRWRKADRT